MFWANVLSLAKSHDDVDDDDDGDDDGDVGDVGFGRWMYILPRRRERVGQVV